MKLLNTYDSTPKIFAEPSKGIESFKLDEIFRSAVDKHIESDEITGIDSVKKEISNAVKVIAEFNDLVDKTDYDLLSALNNKPQERPIAIRAEAVKRELDETKVVSKVFII